MQRLHLRLYLAIVGTLLVFLVSAAVVWHAVASPLGAVWGVESTARMTARLLERQMSPEAQQGLVDMLSRQLHGDVALLARDPATAQIHSSGPIDVTTEQRTEPGWKFHDGPTFGVRLADGRMLLVHPRQRFLLHTLHVVLIMTSVAAILALLTYPIARGITARLGRLKQGVQKFGAGDLSARVAVEGRDEVAALATSFNESASRVEQLVRANQQLLANCSHELRTPLTRLRLAVERIPGSDATGAELRRNITELDALIGELLLTSRLDATHRPQRVETVDLLALAAEEAAYFDREAQGHAVTIEGDPLLLRRLVRNLLENARVHAGGASAVQVRAIDGGAQLVIEDSGPGVAPEDRERIFEPFYRHAGAAAAGGTGLGLAIVRQIARLHRGDVAYESRENGGSRFTATLRGCRDS
jgi:two-component system, OmpR family, sensor histidine kinase RstB